MRESPGGRGLGPRRGDAHRGSWACVRGRVADSSLKQPERAQRRGCLFCESHEDIFNYDAAAVEWKCVARCGVDVRCNKSMLCPLCLLLDTTCFFRA